MKKTLQTRKILGGFVVASVLATIGATGDSRADNFGGGWWLVGTWYLALDTQPLGLPPGVPLSGLAIFNQDGAYQIQDGGDFGQASFLDTRHSYQFGNWRRAGGGKVKGVALFQEADRVSGEVLRWQKVEMVLRHTGDRKVVTGTINVSVLECNNSLPLPTALTCPDPIEAADEFVAVPPTDIPVTLKRLRVHR